jgi:putative photosynthetic complex assembly protein
VTTSTRSAHHHELEVPRAALLGAAGVIALSLGLAAAAGVERARAPAVPAPVELAARDVRFEDRADGAIVVIDAADGREVSVVPPRTNGFIRGVLRGFARNRKLESLGRGGSFRLSRRADGRLSLSDPQTGRRVDLGSFGPTNEAAFAQLLAARAGAP